MKPNEYKKHDFRNELTADVEAIFNELEGKFDKSVIAEQIELEIYGYQMGEQEFYRKLDKAMSQGSIVNAPSFGRPMSEWYGATLELLKAKIEQQDNAGRVRRFIWYVLTKGVPPEIYLKPIIPAIVSAAVCAVGDNKLTSLSIKLGKMVEESIRFYPLITTLEKEWRKRYEAAHSLQKSDKNRREFVKRVEADFVSSGDLDEWNHWTVEDKLKVGYNILMTVYEATGAFELIDKPDDSKLGKDLGVKDYHRFIKIKEEWINIILEEGYHLAGMKPYFLPSIIPPKPWTSFTEGGMWTKGSSNLKLMKFINSPFHKNIVRKQRRCEMPKVFDAINIIQNTSFKTNTFILEVMKQISDNDEMGKVLLDKKKKWVLRETPYQKLRKEFKEITDVRSPTKEEIAKYKEDATMAKAFEKSYISKRRSIDKAMEFAEMYADYAAFYLPHHPDTRGRIYPATNIELHQQSNDIPKSLLYCAEKKPMGERGWYWLKVCCASLGELDNTKNAHPDVRAQWVDDHRDEIYAAVHNPIGMIHWWSEADAPFQFLACCKEVVDAWNYGDPCAFESGFPVNFDGSCSGIQHYSAMLRDEVGGKEVNLIPMETKQDLYGTVARKVTARVQYDRDNMTGSHVETSYGDGSPKPKTWQIAGYWLDYGVGRSLVKQNVMTYAYSSTPEGMKGQLLDVLKDDFGPIDDTSVDPLDIHRFISCKYLSSITHKETAKSVEKATECMIWLQEVVKQLSKIGKGLEYTTPDGFPCFQEYLEQKSKQIDLPNLVYDAGILKPVRREFQPNIKFDTDKISSREQKSSVAPNFIHSMDATHLRMTVRNCYEKGVKSFFMIHDSFGTVPADAQIMFDTVRETMVDLYSRPEWDMIEQIDNYARAHLETESYNSLPPKPSKGKLDLEGIKQSIFAFI